MQRPSTPIADDPAAPGIRGFPKENEKLSQELPGRVFSGHVKPVLRGGGSLSCDEQPVFRGGGRFSGHRKSVCREDNPQVCDPFGGGCRNSNSVATFDTPMADPDMETLRQMLSELISALRRWKLLGVRGLDRALFRAGWLRPSRLRLG